MQKNNIVIACDHAGVELKSFIIDYLEEKEYKVINCGTDNTDSVDYPDMANSLVSEVTKDLDNNIGILICGSGIGISIAANRNKNIRAALCYNEEVSKLSRQHNNANVIVLGARFVDKDEAIKMIDNFINTEFEGGRHERRVSKLS